MGYKCSLRATCANIAWQYLLGSFAPKAVQCFVDENGTAKTSEGAHGFDFVWASVMAMLDEAERAGRLVDLAPPSIKTPEQIIDLLGRRFGNGWVQHLTNLLNERHGGASIQRWNREAGRTHTEVVDVAVEIERRMGLVPVGAYTQTGLAPPERRDYGGEATA